MNRDHRDWNDYGHDQNYNRHQLPQNNRSSRDRHQDHQHQQDRFGQQRDRPFGSSDQYRRDQDGRYPYQGNYSQDQDRFGQNYQDSFRQDPTLPRGREDGDLMGNIRQGYGISSFDGTSDRFNTLNNEHRYGSHQNEQGYYSGNQEGYNHPQLSGGLGDSGLHSDRGVPNYDLRSFNDQYGSGLGSSYGGSNYGGGQGYSGDHQGGTWGNNSYGTTSGNLTGYGPGGESTYGGGMGSTGDTSSSQNSGRGRNELGGF